MDDIGAKIKSVLSLGKSCYLDYFHIVSAIKKLELVRKISSMGGLMINKNGGKTYKQIIFTMNVCTYMLGY